MKYAAILLLILSMPVSAQITKGGIEPGPNDTPKTKPQGGGGDIIARVIVLEKKIQSFLRKFNSRYKSCSKEKGQSKTLTEVLGSLSVLEGQQKIENEKISHKNKSKSARYSCVLNSRIRSSLLQLEKDPLLDHYLTNYEGITERELVIFHQDLLLHGRGM